MLEPNSQCSIPLPHTNWQIYVRPHGWGVGFCDRPLPWQMVERPRAMTAEPMECVAQGTYDEGIFRYVMRNVYTSPYLVFVNMKVVDLNLLQQGSILMKEENATELYIDLTRAKGQ